jgi:hypothetical protein
MDGPRDVAREAALAREWSNAPVGDEIENAIDVALLGRGAAQSRHAAEVGLLEPGRVNAQRAMRALTRVQRGSPFRGISQR